MNSKNDLKNSLISLNSNNGKILWSKSFGKNLSEIPFGDKDRIFVYEDIKENEKIIAIDANSGQNL